MIFKHRNGYWDLSGKILIAGILNVTPDSFSDGRKFFSLEDALTRAAIMIEEGADLIDIGGESTRPGSDSISVEEEMNRVIPVIKALKQSPKTKNCIISIDTTKYEVAKAAIDEGVEIINDISAFRNDERMIKLASESGAGVILMHMQGNPKNMQIAPVYEDVISEILLFLEEAKNKAVEDGIDIENIVLDPGIGFGKSIEDNFKIISEINYFRMKLNRPILIGASRKSFIGRTLNLPIEERLIGSITAAVISAINGASILRVHDVKETRQAITILDKIFLCKSQE